MRTIKPDIGSFGAVNHDDRLQISGTSGPFCSVGIAVNGVTLVFSPQKTKLLIRALKKTLDELVYAGPKE